MQFEQMPLRRIQINTDPKVQAVFDQYPIAIRKKLIYLRSIIIETAEELKDVTILEETLKWGEPSYIVKRGSTIRIDWKPKNPNQYMIYFKCTSALVPRFRMVYKELFTFEGNRAISFRIDERIPEKELKSCIRTALSYHKVKHLPTLGL